MYKKITHQIVEEHFDHPVLAEAAANVGCNLIPMSGHFSTHIPQAAPKSINSDSGIQFRQQVHNYFSDCAAIVRNYIVSAIAGGEDQAVIEDQLFKFISTIGGVVQPYYGEEVAVTVNNMFKDLFTNLVDAIKLVKAGKDTAAAMEKVYAIVGAFASAAHGLNPEYWPESAVNKAWTDIVNAWLAQAVARQKKDWSSDLLAAQNLNMALLSGTAEYSPGFSDVFATGIIRQFPRRFLF